MEKYLLPEEIAEKLSVQADSVRHWLRNGLITGVKLGRIWRIPEKEIERFLKSYSTGTQHAVSH